MLRTIKFAIKLLLIFSLIFVSVVLYEKASIFDTKEVLRITSQFKSLEQKDEYVLAEFKNHEEFAEQKYNFMFGYPIGDTTAKLSIDAFYKYYVKLAELSVKIEGDTIYIHAPKIYLSLPVAFELSSVMENFEQFMFGPGKNELQKKLRQDLSKELEQKGNAQVIVVIDKAAKALADNFNQFLIKAGYGNYYKNIEVSFGDEDTQLQRQFHYNDSFCGDKTCLFELGINKELFFTIR